MDFNKPYRNKTGTVSSNECVLVTIFNFSILTILKRKYFYKITKFTNNINKLLVKCNYETNSK